MKGRAPANYGGRRAVRSEGAEGGDDAIDSERTSKEWRYGPTYRREAGPGEAPDLKMELRRRIRVGGGVRMLRGGRLREACAWDEREGEREGVRV